MCRLYGFRSNEPTKVECTLVLAQNALLAQSRADQRGVAHPDGWGIAIYEDGRPRVEHKSTAAFSDRHFSTTAERILARTVLAHVRRATVGGPAVENCHPFTFGRWTFAHNGTVTGFERVGPRLERETDARLLAERRGATDSESAFLWLLGRLASAGIDLDAAVAEPRRLAELVLEALRALDRLCADEGEVGTARLNFLLTDGELLVATRLRNSLSWVERLGVHDCEICGIPHIQHDERRAYRAVVVASEPISHEAWRELPDGAALLVGRDLEADVLAA